MQISLNGAPNNGMHPTADTPDFMYISLAGRRVMPSVMLLKLNLPLGGEMKTVKQFFGAICLMLLVCSYVFAQREKSVLLPSSEAKNATNQCSRPSPSKFTDTWQPSEAEIREMESRFSQIKKLRVKECCIQGVQIENPERYYMQYVGIIVEGRRLIYVNAFPPIDANEGWKESAVVICDGGNAWGVLYDPKTKKFYDLAINGVA